MAEAPPPISLLLEHADFVRAVARAVLREDDLVEDVVQDTWVVALRGGPRDPSRLQGWLGSIAWRRSRDVQRRRARSARRERTARRPIEGPSVAKLAEQEEARRIVVQAVFGLPEPYRATLLLRYYEDLPIKVVARRLGVPVETVRTRLRRGLDRLRHLLDEAWHGDRRARGLALLPLVAGRAGFVESMTAKLVTVGGWIVSAKHAVMGAAAVLTLLLATVVALRLADTPATDPQPGVPEAGGLREPALRGRADIGAYSKQEAPGARVEADAPPSPATEGLVRLSGVVRDGAGRPVPHAVVYLVDKNRPESDEEFEADDDGGWTITADSIRGTWICAIASPRFVPGYVDGDEVDPDQPVILTLREGREITVEVDGPEGTWPEGCRVVLSNALDVRAYDLPAPEMALTFHVDLAWDPEDPTRRRTVRVPTRGPVGVATYLQRGAVLPRVDRLEPDADLLQLRTMPSCRVEVRVIDAGTGAPLRKPFAVRVLEHDEGTVVMGGSHVGTQARLELQQGVPPGHYRVQVTSVGRKPWIHAIHLTEPGERISLEAALEVDDRRGALRLVPRFPDDATAAERRPQRPGEASCMWRSLPEGRWTVGYPHHEADGRSHLLGDLPEGSYEVLFFWSGTSFVGRVASVRVDAGGTSLNIVPLVRGTFVRLSDLLAPEQEYRALRVSSEEHGEYPLYSVGQLGSFVHLERTDDVERMLRRPREDMVLGPFPAARVEVVATDREGHEHNDEARAAAR